MKHDPRSVPGSPHPADSREDLRALFRRQLGLATPAARGEPAGSRIPPPGMDSPDTFVVVWDFELACGRIEARESREGEVRP